MKLTETRLIGMENYMTTTDTICACCATLKNFLGECIDGIRELQEENRILNKNVKERTQIGIKTLQSWAALDGIKIIDPDGFDRTDTYLFERLFTHEEYKAGIVKSTICVI